MKIVLAILLVLVSSLSYAEEPRLKRCMNVGEYAGLIHSMRGLGVKQEKVLIELKATSFDGFASDEVALELIDTIYKNVPKNARVESVEMLFTKSCLGG